MGRQRGTSAASVASDPRLGSPTRHGTILASGTGGATNENARTWIVVVPCSHGHYCIARLWRRLDRIVDARRNCGGETGTNCASGEYCAYVPGEDCGRVNATATCKKRPEVCPEDLRACVRVRRQNVFERVRSGRCRGRLRPGGPLRQWQDVWWHRRHRLPGRAVLFHGRGGLPRTRRKRDLPSETGSVRHRLCARVRVRFGRLMATPAPRRPPASTSPATASACDRARPRSTCAKLRRFRARPLRLPPPRVARHRRACFAAAPAGWPHRVPVKGNSDWQRTRLVVCVSPGMKDRHIVIIGGGLAGLSAGCYARASGFRTTIVEHNLALGGVCTAWTRGPYTIDGCIQWLTGAPLPGSTRSSASSRACRSGPPSAF